ncbi:hypothetical protein ACTACT_10010 [Pseudomonas syringae]|uniref:hypothetical protein n=1 Tax=Pseudomonas syringae TaxID=317 RepID=UPI003F7567BE
MLTEGVVQNTNAIMMYVKLLEDTFLRAGTAVTAATVASTYASQNDAAVISLPAVMLEKEMVNLIFSLDDLKSVVKGRLGSTLHHLNNILTDAAAFQPVITEPSLVKVRRDYQDALVQCIITLDLLNDELFKEEPI